MCVWVFVFVRAQKLGCHWSRSFSVFGCLLACVFECLLALLALLACRLAGLLFVLLFNEGRGRGGGGWRGVR